MTMTLVRADYLHKVGQHFTSSSAVTVPASARSSSMSGRHLDSNRSQPQVGASNGRTALSRLVLIGSGSATTER
jgi:hypothetical protein